VIPTISVFSQTATETEDEDVASAVSESTMSMSTQDKQQLQEKLAELQMKKHHMDQLLDELHALRLERDIHDNGQLHTHDTVRDAIFLFCSLAVLDSRVGHTNGRTFSIYSCPLSFRLTLPRRVVFTS